MGIEHLIGKGVVKNRHLARPIAAMDFFEFGRQLEYKARQRGRMVVVSARWFASSKTFSRGAHQLES